MTTPGAPYLNRADAGRRLAEVLARYRQRSLTVLALPRGGVPIASVVADRLDAPLDILVVRKVGAPGNREYGLGAVAEGGVRYMDWDRVRELDLGPEQLDPEIRAQTEEVDRLARRLRGGRSPPVLHDRAVGTRGRRNGHGRHRTVRGRSGAPATSQPPGARRRRLVPGGGRCAATSGRRARLPARTADALRGRRVVSGVPSGFRR